MSNKVISLAIKVAGDATRLNLTPAERALQSLQAETQKIVGVFQRFGEESEAASQAQQKFGTDLAFLTSALRTGQVSSADFAREFATITKAANEEADAIKRAADLTAQFQTEASRFADTQRELNSLFEDGLLSLEVYSAAIEDAARGLSDAEREAAGLAARSAGDAAEEISPAVDQATLSTEALADSLRVLPGFLGQFVATSTDFINNAASVGTRLGRLQQEFTDFLRVANPLGRVFGFLSTRLGQVAAALAVSGGIAAGLSSLSSRVQRLTNLSERLGISFRSIQILEEAAKRSGSSVDIVAAAFTRLQRTLAGADTESKKAVSALRAIGLTVDDIRDQEPEQQYEIIGRALLSIEEPAKRTSAAIELFGKTGATLLPFFRSIPEAADDFARFGSGITDADRDRLLAFNSSLDSLSKALSRLGEEAVLPFAGLATGITTASAQFVSSILSIVDSLGNLLTPALDQIGTLIGLTMVVVEQAAAVFRTLANALEPIGKFLLPALVAQLAFTNRALVAGAAQSFLRTIVSLRSTTISYTAATRSLTFSMNLFNGATRVATISMAGLRVATIGFLSSTGVGIAVVAVGLLVERLYAWATASDAAADGMDGAADAAARAAAITEKYGNNIADIIAENKNFVDTLSDIDRGVSDAIEQAAAFGEAGFNAAVRYQDAIEDLKERLDGGLFNQETFVREAAKVKKAFEAELNRIEQDAQLEIQIQENVRQVLAGIESQIGSAIDEAEEFGEAGFDAVLPFQRALRDLADQFERGAINQETLERNVDKAREGLAKQLGVLKEITQEQEKQAEADRRRVQELLGAEDTALQKLRDDIAAVERERERERGRADSAGATQREAELRKLARDLRENFVAVSLGFEQGFDKAFESTNDGFERLLKQVDEFGERTEDAAQGLVDGIDVDAVSRRFQQLRQTVVERPDPRDNLTIDAETFRRAQEAASRLSEGLRRAQEQARVGLLGREEYDEQVSRLEDLYRRDLKNIRDAAAERKKVNEFVDEQLLLSRFDGDQSRLSAARNVVTIEREIARVQSELTRARRDGDKELVSVAVQRLQQLDQVAAKERDIASGRQALEDEIAKQREDSLKAFEDEQERVQKQQEEAREQQQKIFEDQFRRFRDRSTLGAGVIAGTDVRTTEGATAFLQLANQRQDPVLVEARLQSKRLGQIVTQVERLTGLPVVTFGPLGVG